MLGQGAGFDRPRCGTGGAGGREGPTMQIGGALGSLVAGLAGERARTAILLVAGVAAGISAVFRTPLGAALLAVEVLYKDGFESDALIPSVLASVVSYSVVISIFGEHAVRARSPAIRSTRRICRSTRSSRCWWPGSRRLCSRSFGRCARCSRRLRVAAWARPALGGLALGVFAMPLIIFLGGHITSRGRARHPRRRLRSGPGGDHRLAVAARRLDRGRAPALAVAKSSPPRSPSGPAAARATSRPRSPSAACSAAPSAAPRSSCSTIRASTRARLPWSAWARSTEASPTCRSARSSWSASWPELQSPGAADARAGHRLRRPAQAFALRGSGGHARESPVHRDTLILSSLQTLRVSDVMDGRSPPVCLSPDMTLSQVLEHAGNASDQELFPVVSAEGGLVGLVTSATMRVASAQLEDSPWAIAADLMQAPVFVQPSDDLRTAGERMVSSGLRVADRIQRRWRGRARYRERSCKRRPAGSQACGSRRAFDAAQRRPPLVGSMTVRPPRSARARSRFGRVSVAVLRFEILAERFPIHLRPPVLDVLRLVVRQSVVIQDEFRFPRLRPSARIGLPSERLRASYRRATLHDAHPFDELDVPPRNLRQTLTRHRRRPNPFPLALPVNSRATAESTSAR